VSFSSTSLIRLWDSLLGLLCVSSGIAWEGVTDKYLRLDVVCMEEILEPNLWRCCGCGSSQGSAALITDAVDFVTCGDINGRVGRP
jgi:hypothetical protein